MRYKFKDYQKSEILTNHLNMGGENPNGEKIDVTSLYFMRNEKPWIGVMGEYHFVRDSRDNWYRELCKMKAGGITVVATYLFWIYHEETEDFRIGLCISHISCVITTVNIWKKRIYGMKKFMSR